jgi:excisionase family DNA binding protein
MVKARIVPRVERETITLAELAIRLGISATTAYELAARGELPVKGFKVGREYRFPRAQVDKLLGVESDASGSTAA